MRELLVAAGFIFVFSISGSTFAQEAAKPSEKATTSSSSRLPLKPCRVSGLKTEALCGTYDVYEDRARQAGRKIPLNIIVVPALDPAPAPDPLVVLVGGPGQAATDGAASQAARFDYIRSERDIVLIDQRGTGRSNGLNCDLGGLPGIVRSFVAGDFPLDKIGECRRQLEARADLRFYATPIAMDDLDEVRGWLGYDKLNLYGGSYGTRPALVYLRRHPTHVRTVTIRGVYSLNPLYFARDTERALDLLFDDCAKDEACAKAFPNLRGNFQTVTDRLAQSPAAVERISPKSGELTRIPVTREGFIGGVRRLLYETETQRFIPLMIHKAVLGNYQPFEMVVEQVAGLLNSFSVGMFLSVACPEGISGISRSEIQRAEKSSSFGGYMVKGAVDACGRWAKADLPVDYFDPISSEAPVVILSGQIDPVTPPVWGEEAAKTLPNSTQVTMEGIAHGPFPPCALEIMTRFVKTGTIKGLDTSGCGNLRRPGFVLPSTVESNAYEPAGPIEDELFNLERELIEAVSQGDRARLDAVLPDDFQQSGLTDWTQDRENKAMWIDRVVRVATQVEGGVFSLEKPLITVRGETAVVQGGWRLKGTLRGRDLAKALVFADILNKRDGKWRLVTRLVKETT
jgi:pimeloyl-ACP methyl ester carboxylesterase